jgi:hypothetical protein
MSTFMGRLAIRGLRHGLLEGRRGWLIVGVSAGTIATLRKLLREKEVVAITQLRADESIEIRVVEPKR